MMIAINLNNTNTNFIYIQDWVTNYHWLIYDNHECSCFLFTPFL